MYMSEKSDRSAGNGAENSSVHAVDTHSSMFHYDSLRDRIREDFSHLQEWASGNPDVIAEHFDLYERHITDLKTSELSGQAINHRKEREYADYFGITNLGRLPPDTLRTEVHAWRQTVGLEPASLNFSSPRDAVRQLTRYIPGDVPDDLAEWSGERLERLYHILPEFVLRQEGMKKVLRTMMGVVALAAAESHGDPSEERRDRIAKAVAPAYFYAATYPIVDDILHDSDYVSDSKDKSRYHAAIIKGLSTGEDINESELPDHPLAEEMLAIYNEMRQILPFDKYRDTYYALESMYLAQHLDANINVSDLSEEADLYVPITIKASLSRIVAHMITGHDIGPERAARMLRTLLRQQIADDQRDIVDDLHERRATPFTLRVTNPELEFTNPLFYRIAQEAYVWHEVYAQEDSERVREALSKFGAYDMAHTLSSDAAHAYYITEHFGDQGGPLDHLIRTASCLGKVVVSSVVLSTPDKHLAKTLNENIPDRDPQLMDPRTYISDALPYINEILLSELDENSELEEVMRYALESGGKRVRPAMTLMLAESLGVSRESLRPLLISTEFAHTASLIFDDLPAQDNATLRRGREAVHIKFSESDAQLAGISMIAHSIGVLGRLGEHFSADRVNEVVQYMGMMLGAQKLCLGQHMDLAGKKYGTTDEIIEMYSLKTSTMIEGALVPLMMLAGRPGEEVEAMRQYAYHAGIVFQLRDDILDTTSTPDMMGKNSEQDGDKQNIVTTLGIDGAQSLLDMHLQSAVESLDQLPFPTDLLRGIATYFATRKK